MSLVKRLKLAFRQRFARNTETPFAAVLLSSVVPLLHATWRVEVQHEARMQALLAEHGAVILVTWHGNMLVPIACTQGRGYYALVSRSGDGGMLSAIFTRLGWRLIRGSSGRGAVEALRAGCAALAQAGTVLAFTPDGPRGPARVAKPGMIYFAQKMGKPIIPVGVSARPRKRLSSWDAFQVPLPFARCVWIYGEPIFAAAGDDVAALARRVQEDIDALDQQAEAILGYRGAVSDSAGNELKPV